MSRSGGRGGGRWVIFKKKSGRKTCGNMGMKIDRNIDLMVQMNDVNGLDEK